MITSILGYVSISYILIGVFLLWRWNGKFVFRMFTESTTDKTNWKEPLFIFLVSPISILCVVVMLVWDVLEWAYNNIKYWRVG